MKKVLIVEDEAVVACDIWHQLELLGYEPAATAPAGEEALLLAEQLHPDVVLMDIRLAGAMDGIAAAAAIRQQFDIPVVFLTAFIGDANLDRIKSAKPCGYIVKPFEERELRVVIEMALYKDQADKALKAANLKLRENEIQLQVILESTADGILAVNNSGRVVMCNRRFAELWRIPPPLMSGGDDKALLDFALRQLADPEAFLEKVQSLYGTNEGITDTVRFKDGRIFERHSAPTMRDGIVTGRVWSFSDITDRKTAEAQRERLAVELDQKNQELENVLYAASHDLRSPLLNLQGFGQRLEQSCGELSPIIQGAGCFPELREAALRLLEDRIPTALRFIKSSVGKMDQIIGGLLRLSRLGQVAMRREILDMNAVLHQVVDAMAFQIQSTGALVEMGPLPACEGDALLVGQAFSNLLDNAVKYRDPARPLVIHVTGRIEGAESVYCVEDTGAGIASEEQSKIWELFCRLNPAGSIPGEGLGLNLVRRIIERHNGRIWVESELGRGSRFFASLPAGGAK
jgi:PAS domain S-box-containing protein